MVGVGADGGFWCGGLGCSGWCRGCLDGGVWVFGGYPGAGDGGVWVLDLDAGGEQVLPKIRRSGRKRPIRSVAGHLLKSKPKSPLMRLAKMRRSGLWGGALRALSLKESGGSVLKSKKGRKGSAGRGLQVVVSDLESSGDMVVSPKGVSAAKRSVEMGREGLFG